MDEKSKEIFELSVNELFAVLFDEQYMQRISSYLEGMQMASDDKASFSDIVQIVEELMKYENVKNLVLAGLYNAILNSRVLIDNQFLPLTINDFIEHTLSKKEKLLWDYLMRDEYAHLETMAKMRTTDEEE